MKVYKSTKSLVKNQVFQLAHKEQKLLNYIKQTKSNCLIRDGNFAKEIVAEFGSDISILNISKYQLIEDKLESFLFSLLLPFFFFM